MAVTEVEPAAPGSVCTRVRVKYAKYRGQHLDEKWRVIRGDGKETGRIICEACATPAEHQSINRAEQRERDEEDARIAADEARKHRNGWERYWPWAWVAGGSLAYLFTWWLISGLAGAVALIAFAFLAPVPCRSTADADPEPCDEWARGFLRACPDRTHAKQQHDLLIEGWREHRRPRLVWDERMAKGAIVGAFLSTALLAFSAASYLWTVIF